MAIIATCWDQNHDSVSLLFTPRLLALDSRSFCPICFQTVQLKIVNEETKDQALCLQRDFPQSWTVSLNQHKGWFLKHFLCVLHVGLHFLPKCILFGRTVFLLINIWSLWRQILSLQLKWKATHIMGIGPFEPSWKNPPSLPLQSCFVTCPGSPGPFQHMIHSALLEVLVPYRPFFWKSSEDLQKYLCDIPQGCC